MTPSPALRDRWYRERFYRQETLSAALLRAAREHAAVPFHFHTDQGLRTATVGDIGAAAQAMAGALQKMGVRPGDVFAMQLPSWYETAVLYVAAFHAGATVLPIVHTYGPAELDFILRDSQARWLAVPDRWRDVDYGEKLARTPAVSGLDRVIVVGDRELPNSVTWKQLQEGSSAPFTEISADADNQCVLLYTSGTTAQPKGVRHTHNTIRSEWEIEFFANRGPYLNPFPAGHIAGFNFMLRPMVCGIEMVLLDRWEPRAAAELVDRFKVTQSGGTPYFMMTLLEAAQQGGHDLSSIAAYGLGATGVRPEHVKLTDELGWRGGRSYGLTEHSTVSMTHPSMTFEQRAYTDGRLQRASEVRIVDEAGRDLLFDTEGEILTCGPELFIGYTDAERSREAFFDDGWFRTGDIGRVSRDGLVTITDRKKDIIIRGGENISSREVEELLMRHAAVLDAAAVAMPDDRLGEKVCAFIVVKPGAAVDDDALRQHCLAAGLARFKIPERLERLTELPRNAAGKVRKDELRQRLRRP